MRKESTWLKRNEGESEQISRRQQGPELDFFKSSFIEYISQIIKFTQLKCKIHWVSIYLQTCVSITTI